MEIQFVPSEGEARLLKTVLATLRFKRLIAL